MSYSWIPRVLGFVAAAVIALMVDPANLNSAFSASLSLGQFFNEDTTPKLLYMMMGRLDIFVLWQTFLIGVGLSVTGKISRSQAFVAAAIVWLVGSLLTVALRG